MRAQAFPQANWRQLVPQTVMEKFAASQGGSFPAPQYSDGLTMALAATGPEQHAAPGSSGGKALKGTGVALIGDAAHCFPPDLGRHVLLGPAVQWLVTWQGTPLLVLVLRTTERWIWCTPQWQLRMPEVL